MNHKAFVTGNFDTHFVEKYFDAEFLDNSQEDEAMIAALIAVKLLKEVDTQTETVANNSHVSNWKRNRAS